MGLPLVRLSGDAFEQGVQHGRALRPHIRHNLALYIDRFQRECRLSVAEVVRRARLYARAVADHNPAYAAGVRGVAVGSLIDPELIWALNVRYEIVYYEYTQTGMADGCTSLAVAPTHSTDSHVYLAQNWDWYPGIRGALLHTEEADGLQTLAFSEAGIVGGKIGLNSAGVGLLINGLNSAHDDWSQLEKPFHVHCYEVLRQPDFAGAVAAVTDSMHGCSANFVIGHADGSIVNIEMAPIAYNALPCVDGCLAHTNHFLDPDALGVRVPQHERIYTTQRYSRAKALLDSAAAPIGRQQLAAILSDHEHHPHGLCQHANPAEPPHEWYSTVASVILDLTERTVHVAAGQPCSNPYRAVPLHAPTAAPV